MFWSATSTVFARLPYSVLPLRRHTSRTVKHLELNYALTNIIFHFFITQDEYKQIKLRCCYSTLIPSELKAVFTEERVRLPYKTSSLTSWSRQQDLSSALMFPHWQIWKMWILGCPSQCSSFICNERGPYIPAHHQNNEHDFYALHFIIYPRVVPTTITACKIWTWSLHLRFCCMPLRYEF